jgi:hypothetical protein
VQRPRRQAWWEWGPCLASLHGALIPMKRIPSGFTLHISV